jgi:hypothetical protein
MREEISLLGHRVSANGLKVDQKLRAVADWKVPGDVRISWSEELLSKVSSRLLEDGCLLSNLNRKYKRWEWTKELQEAFGTVKYALTNAPVLAPPELGKPFEMVYDASAVGLEAILLQDGCPVAFESKKLFPVEQNYKVTKQETLGVIHAFKTWRCCLKAVISPL